MAASSSGMDSICETSTVAADSDFDAAAALVQKLGGQGGGAQQGMDHPEHLERDAVGAADEDRQRFRAGDADEAGGGGAPLGIANGAGAEIEVSHFAGGEDQQHAAGFDVGDGLFEGAAVGKAAFGALEGVDENAEFGEFGQFAEYLVGQHADVGADAGEQRRQQHSVEQPEGVVGDGDDGSGDRDLLQIFRA